MYRRLILPTLIIVLAISVAGCGSTPANTNQPVANTNNATSNENVNADINTNSSTPGITTNENVELRGTVFIKGYDTPSESYGIITTENQEIGLGSYDSMKEQFRPYVGDPVKIVFSNVCRSSSTNCCRTIFQYCGTVASWEPIE